MDLREITSRDIRHPWETARVQFLSIILNSLKINFNRVLDVGCGDGFTVKKLAETCHFNSVDAVDSYLSDDQILEFSKNEGKINFHKTYGSLPKRSYNLILLLDIVEHVEDDRSFLQEIVDKYLEKNNYALVTAPAFQFLCSHHDTFLGHYRRYNLKSVEVLVKKSNLEPVASGYLFFTLLPIRYFSVFFTSTRTSAKRQYKGVGDWRCGKFITKMIEKWLIFENRILLILGGCGIKLPGLTVWCLCRNMK
jgi:SAM-dependent methyltransferase